MMALLSTRSGLLLWLVNSNAFLLDMCTLLCILQVMCVLVNFASGSAKSRDAVVHCDDIMKIIAEILVSLAFPLYCNSSLIPRPSPHLSLIFFRTVGNKSWGAGLGTRLLNFMLFLFLFFNPHEDYRSF